MQYYNKDDIFIEEIVSKHINDLTNLKFEKWNVVGYAGLTKDLKSLWWCFCDCNPNKFYQIVGTELVQGRTKSCGCNIAIENKKRSYLHKDAEKFNVSLKTIKRLHTIFKGMKNRCYNKLSKDYPNYGYRGIIIYDDWLLDINNFVDWSIKNDYNDNLTIDRIDVNGNYEPSNCRWITKLEQNRNKTTTIYLDYNGEKRTLNSILNDFGIKNNYSTYRSRILNNKWSIEKAISTPVRTHIKEKCLEYLLHDFKNTYSINKKEFCLKYKIDVSTLNRYLKQSEFITILNKNNIIDTNKGELIKHDK